MTSQARPSVSVVIPVHNEAGYLPGAVDRLLADLDSVDAAITVLLAENGSTDGTGDVARALARSRPRLSVLELEEADYGAAMRAGFLAAEGDWVVNFDIDYFSGDFLTTALGRDDADIVLASKRAPGSEDRRSAFRRAGTWGFNLLLRGLLSSRVSDTHGMKAIRSVVVDAVVPQVRSTKDLFDTELVVRAERAGYRIVEVPVVVQEERASKSSLLRRVPRTLSGLWAIRQSIRP